MGRIQKTLFKSRRHCFPNFPLSYQLKPCSKVLFKRLKVLQWAESGVLLCKLNSAKHFLAPAQQWFNILCVVTILGSFLPLCLMKYIAACAHKKWTRIIFYQINANKCFEKSNWKLNIICPDTYIQHKYPFPSICPFPIKGIISFSFCYYRMSTHCAQNNF